jgi:hypothetical protein
MTRHPRAVLIAGAAALALACVPARADSLVVAEAHGGALRAGQTLEAAQPVRLEAGQRLTLIAGNGAVIKLIGPFDGVPDPEGQRLGNVADSLLKLASQTAQGTATLGAVRAPESPPPEPWLVAVGSSGQRCLQEGRPVVFWHPAPAAEAMVEISPLDHAWQAETKWPAGLDRLAMPADFPAEDDRGYVIAVGGDSATVTLHIMPPVFSSDAMRAAWMLEKGCVGQARVLVDRLK